MRTFKFYQVKPSVESKNVRYFSGDKAFIERMAAETGGVVVEKEVVSFGLNQETVNILTRSR